MMSKRRASKLKLPTIRALKLKWWKVLLLALLLLVMIPPLQVWFVRKDNPSRTTVMWQRSLEHSDWPQEQEWMPLQKMPADLIWFTLLSEDGRFFDHGGVDWKELSQAIKASRSGEGAARGASTISMQAARSLFLWQGRSYLRKLLEVYYTFWMERILSKERILELYLNVLETGPGVYGMPAGAHYQFDLPLKDLSRKQLALLVAILPNPIERAAYAPTAKVQAKQRWILKYATRWQKPEALDKF